MKKFMYVTCTLLIMGIGNSYAQSNHKKETQKKGVIPMVVSVHDWELEEGVDEAKFETFIQEKIIPLYQKVEGQDMLLMKGDRGMRSGKYSLFLIFDSVETRDRIYPPAGGISKNFEKILEGTEEIWEQLNTYTAGEPFTTHTDYIKVTPGK